MQWTGLNELREKYLTFFEGKGHLRLGSFPLVPKDDPSLLLINSGMAPMKKWFLGQEEPPPPPCDHLPEVHPHPRHRAGGHHCAARHLLRDAGQLLVPGLFPRGSHPLGLGVFDRRGVDGHSQG